MVFLIGGHQRSGTTLLRDLCNSHPHVTITNEFANFCDLGKPYSTHKLRILKKLRWDILLKNQILFPEYYRKRLKNEGIKLLIQRGRNVFRNQAFVALYLIKMKRYRHQLVNAAAIESTLRSIFPKALVVGDKFPDYIFSIEKFLSEIEISLLMICRDCCDVVSSALYMAKTDWRKEPWVVEFNTAEKVARRWVYTIELMERYKNKLYIIRYEDLVFEKKNTLEALGGWLGVDPSDFRSEIIKDTSIAKYKNSLTDAEVLTVMEIAGPTMTKLGYHSPNIS